MRIRPVALALLRRGSSLLVFDGYDAVKGERFCRPLGGGVEFGERGADAVVRELWEEIGERIVDVRYAGMIENLFTYDGKPGHEIVLLFDARFANPEALARDAFTCVEGDQRFSVRWLDLDTCDGGTRLYPEGLIDVVRA